MKTKLAILLSTVLLAAAPLRAGVYVPITIDGDFSDWASVPALTTPTINVGSPVDYVTLYAANDDNFLYIRFVLSAAADLNGSGTSPYIAIDNDNNPATGYNIFGLNVSGSEVGWVNDYPFAQSAGVFNSGSVNGGGAIIAPFNTNTISQEIAISRSATFETGGGSIFPNNTFSISMYTSGTTTDAFIGAGEYTFAIPEPGTAALLVLGVAGVALLRRRRMAA